MNSMKHQKRTKKCRDEKEVILNWFRRQSFSVDEDLYCCYRCLVKSSEDDTSDTSDTESIEEEKSGPKSEELTEHWEYVEKADICLDID